MLEGVCSWLDIKSEMEASSLTKVLEVLRSLAVPHDGAGSGGGDGGGGTGGGTGAAAGAGLAPAPALALAPASNLRRKFPL